jgi:hypothetical protein
MAKLKSSLLSWSVVKKMTIGIECHDMRQMKTFLLLVDLMFVLNATFSNISAISWRPALVVEEAGENHRPWASNW